MINISKTKALGFVDEFGRFTDMKTTLHNTLSKAVMEVASGSTDFNTAMRRTVETLGGSGIRVNYGGGITRRLDSAVRQNILWGAKQASNEYNEMIGEELGCDGIEIDWHSNPRPSHEFMQGKQYSLSGKKTVNGVTYESADRALAALEDYGCLHIKTPIILGVSEPRFSEEELAELNRQNSEPITINGVTKSGYEWKQGMRRLESAVREQETIKATAKASGNNILADECDERIKAFKNKYNEISKATGIAKQPDRMSPSKPQNVLTNNTNGIIMKKNKGLELSRYVNSSDRLYEYARNITPLDGYEDQVIHGDKYGFEIRDLDGKTASVYTPREFAEILRRDPNYHGGNIRLISCYAGAEDGNAAQALANQLGVDVLAPNDVVIVYPDGSMKIGYDGKGKWILYRKR
ncbi:MAG: hypothetical protein J6K88_02020 [Oscillospiraceae bacterium]|nr:hypothetical protein [Oscillospiraceae bacterium]